MFERDQWLRKWGASARGHPGNACFPHPTGPAPAAAPGAENGQADDGEGLNSWSWRRRKDGKGCPSFFNTAPQSSFSCLPSAYALTLSLCPRVSGGKMGQRLCGQPKARLQPDVELTVN